MIAVCLLNWLLSADMLAGVRIYEHLVVVPHPELSLGPLVVPSAVSRGLSIARSCYSVKLRSKINGYLLVGPSADLIEAVEQNEVV